MNSAHQFARLGTGASWLGQRVVDFLMPPKCLICHDGVSVHGGVCPSCWQSLSIIEAPVCDRLGVPFPFDPGSGILSARAIAQPPNWDRARASVEFDECSRKLVHALKYHDNHHVAGIMAAMMTRAGSKLLSDCDALVPVPLHRTRLWQRRFNQSALLAHHLSKKTNVSFKPELLTRIKPTRTQVGLDHSARKKNLRGAFAVKDENLLQVSDHNIVLVDDVLTTGATADACSRALIKAGAKRVDVLVFALVVQPLRLHI